MPFSTMPTKLKGSGGAVGATGAGGGGGGAAGGGGGSQLRREKACPSADGTAREAAAAGQLAAAAGPLAAVTGPLAAAGPAAKAPDRACAEIGALAGAAG